MRVGVTLPQFSERADRVLDAARRAEELGLDGVFCFDHLWPMGRPDRPALAALPLLGAVAAATSTIAFGTLVARVGLLPDAELAAALVGLSVLGGGRMIAGLGTGDQLSRAENLAFGVPFESADVRRSRLVSVANEVAGAGVPVWVGGGQERTVAVARSLGAPVNLWGASPQEVAAVAAGGSGVTWGGPVGSDAGETTSLLVELARAGATWAVCAWPDSLEMVAEAARAAGGVSGADGAGR
jgi:alkanesulfonate monooxygenase SsuD/methylene tetrahydromethanopterin reductase-like flavin-dependent oxidoreductase (luciferase family)